MARLRLAGLEGQIDGHANSPRHQVRVLQSHMELFSKARNFKLA